MSKLTEQEAELHQLEKEQGPELMGTAARFILLIALGVIILVPVTGQVIHGLANPPLLELKLFGIEWPAPAQDAAEPGDARGEGAPGDAGIMAPLRPEQKRMLARVSRADDVPSPSGNTVYVNVLRGIELETLQVFETPDEVLSFLEKRTPSPADRAGIEERDPQEVSLLEHLRSYEAELENDSFFVEPYQEIYNEFLYLAFGEGNTRVRVTDRFDDPAEPTLVFWPNLTSLTARGPFAEMPISVSQPPPEEDKEHPWVRPMEAITHFAEQLRERDIQLVLAPVPHKTQIYPEILGLNRDEPLRYNWQDQLYQQLEDAGVHVVDLTDALWQRREIQPLYLLTDTHWNNTGLRLAAQTLAQELRRLPVWSEIAGSIQLDRTGFEIVKNEVTNTGDLNRMLGMPEDLRVPAPETAEVRQIVNPDTGQALPDAPESPVVLLGDSYVNVFHANSEDVSWGAGAGLPEHLAWQLNTPLSTMAINGSGQTEARRQLIRKHGDLSGKKLVVWVLNIRSLFLPEALQRVEPDKWEMVDFPQPGSTPQQPDASDQPEAEAKDFPPEFAARVWAYRQEEPVKGARLREGQEVLITVEPLDEVIRSENLVGQTDYLLPEYYIPDFRVLE